MNDLGILTTHNERREIYRLLTEISGEFLMNEAIKRVSDEEFKTIVERAKLTVKQKEKEKEKEKRKKRWNKEKSS